MRRKTLVWRVSAAALLTVATASIAQAAAPAKCEMGQVAELKVEFTHLRPVLPGVVNGQPVRILVDTGAGGSMLFRSTAQRLHLTLRDAPNYRLYGAGGNAVASIANLTNLQLLGFTKQNFDILVAGERKADVDMLLGEDFWSQADEEFNLKDGVIRLLKISGCSDDQMPYWAKSAYNETPLTSSGPRDLLTVDVKINGRKVHAILDSGAQTSVITPVAAQMAGATLEEGEGSSAGVGGEVMKNQLAKLNSFAIGDEVINTTRMRVADLFGRVGFKETGSRLASQPNDLPAMLLGADFLRSHRVLIARARHMVYFTYEGGPVFDLRAPPASAVEAPPSSSAGPSPAPGPAGPGD